MKTVLKTTIKPVFTTAEQAKINEVSQIVAALVEAANNNDEVMLLDRDGEDIFPVRIAKNVASALEALGNVEVE